MDNEELGKLLKGEPKGTEGIIIMPKYSTLKSLLEVLSNSFNIYLIDASGEYRIKGNRDDIKKFISQEVLDAKVELVDSTSPEDDTLYIVVDYWEGL